MIIDAIIETPLNSSVKYEYDNEYKLIRYDRSLKFPMKFPCNYGYIPNTLGGDNDPLDILVLTDFPLEIGIIIKCKIIGVLDMIDEKGIDEKIIGVPIDMININELNDISNNLLKKIRYFFDNYKNHEKNKFTKIKDLHDKEKAINLIKKYKFNNKL